MDKAVLLWNQAKVQAAREGRLPSDVLRDVRAFAEAVANLSILKESQ
jgi:hypothetical protein